MKKLTIEFIREEFAKEGYELLTTVYENNMQKLEYICPRGHRHSVSWGNWQQNQRCPCFSNTMKPTIEFIRSEFAKEDYELLTTKYDNGRQKLDYVCPRGHRHRIDWNHWSSKEKHRCPYCYGNAKKTIEFIRAEFAKEDYTLLTTVYEGSKQKLEYICPNDHQRFMTWNSWHQGERCPCFSKYNNEITIEFIRAEFAKEDYELLTEVYENAHQKLEYICPIGHRHSITWNNWSTEKKRRCPYCSDHVKLTIEFIRAEFAKEDYELLTTVYENNMQKLEYICSEGCRHFVSWGNWSSKDKHKCPCFSNKIKPTIEFIRAEFAKEDYELLTTVYKNNKQKLEYVCPRGHRHSVVWSSWNCKNKYRCPKCNNNGVSKWEKEVKKFLTESNIDHIPNDRTQLVNPETGYNLELDIWIPDKMKAIECNGLYWHSKNDRKECDKVKQQLCKKQGIDLLVLTDKEWGDTQKKCKIDILEFLKARPKSRQLEAVNEHKQAI